MDVSSAVQFLLLGQIVQVFVDVNGCLIARQMLPVMRRGLSLSSLVKAKQRVSVVVHPCIHILFFHQHLHPPNDNQSDTNDVCKTRGKLIAGMEFQKCVEETD